MLIHTNKIEEKWGYFMGIELEEYKILQDKIDKIGDFRFKIKGWTITLFTGFILGTIASPLPRIAFLFALVME